jgi:prepilin-type N-terminal cleavage/methylation domain-containing protein
MSCEASVFIAVGIALAQLSAAMCLHSETTSIALRRAAKGFTLVEVMTVSAVISILTMVAMPAYQQWNARYQLRQATEEVAGNLKLARMAAMSRGANVAVTFAVVAGKAQLSTGGVFPPVVLSDGVTGVTPATVTFSQLGLRVGGGAGNQLLMLTSKSGAVYSVLVTPSGKVNWCKTASCP